MRPSVHPRPPSFRSAHEASGPGASPPWEPVKSVEFAKASASPDAALTTAVTVCNPAGNSHACREGKGQSHATAAAPAPGSLTCCGSLELHGSNTAVAKPIAVPFDRQRPVAVLMRSDALGRLEGSCKGR